jgi:hypothetical protein
MTPTAVLAMRLGETPGRASLQVGFRSMSLPVTHSVTVVGEIARPYGDVPVVEIADHLESQYERGESFDEVIVFELLNRVLEADEVITQPRR